MTKPDTTEAVAEALTPNYTKIMGIPEMWALEHARVATAAHEAAMEQAGWVWVPREATEMELTKAHAAGMRAGMTWEKVTQTLSLHIMENYLPAARQAMIEARPK